MLIIRFKKYIYKIDETICKYKIRLVVRSYAQKNDIDYKKLIFSDHKI